MLHLHAHMYILYTCTCALCKRDLGVAMLNYSRLVICDVSSSGQIWRWFSWVPLSMHSSSHSTLVSVSEIQYKLSAGLIGQGVHVMCEMGHVNRVHTIHTGSKSMSENCAFTWTLMYTCILCTRIKAVYSLCCMWLSQWTTTPVAVNSHTTHGPRC